MTRKGRTPLSEEIKGIAALVSIRPVDQKFPTLFAQRDFGWIGADAWSHHPHDLCGVLNHLSQSVSEKSCVTNITFQTVSQDR